MTPITRPLIFSCLYRICWYLSLPLVLLRLLWRARLQPKYRQHIPERFGYYTHDNWNTQARIWIHAVSVGETQAARPLIQALLTAYPQHQILISQFTPTGRETAENLFSHLPNVHWVYLPYDLPCFIKRFLRHFQPDIGILMETELWPNLIGVCHKQKIPIILANARLSEHSAQRYHYLAKTTASILQQIHILAQTEQDKKRLKKLGAQHILVTGNLKFDAIPPYEQLQLGQKFQSIIGQRKVLLAASTRSGEESLILKAFLRYLPSDVLLIIVPRHPQRFHEITELLNKMQISFQLRSQLQTIDPNTQVWLGDSMGEMYAYYACAQLTLMGGSWLPFGGQNLIESCAVGTPVIIGPHTYNFTQAVNSAIKENACLQFQDLDLAMQHIKILLMEEQQRFSMQQSALNFSQKHKGATQKTLNYISQLLDKVQSD